MKKTSRPMIIAMCALVAALGVGGTIAWLTDSTVAVENTFTAGDVDITLTESTGEDYKMVPGNDISKDPTVTVEKGSEACWLFVQVKEADNAIDGVKFIEWAVDTAAGEWTQLGSTTAEGVSTYYRAVAATESSKVSFNVLQTKDGYANGYVTVNDEVTKQMMEAIDGLNNDGTENSTEKQPKLTFKAFAVQQANINDVNAAWSKIADSEKLS